MYPQNTEKYFKQFCAILISEQLIMCLVDAFFVTLTLCPEASLPQAENRDGKGQSAPGSRRTDLFFLPRKVQIPLLPPKQDLKKIELLYSENTWDSECILVWLLFLFIKRENKYCSTMFLLQKHSNCNRNGRLVQNAASS